MVDWKEDENLKTVSELEEYHLVSTKSEGSSWKNGEDAIIMTSQSRVLFIELRDKYVMVAPNDFEKFFKEF